MQTETESEFSVSNENQNSNNSNSDIDSVISKIRNFIPRDVETSSLFIHFTLQDWNKFLSMTTCVKRLRFKVEFADLLSIKLQQAGKGYLSALIN